MLSFLARGTTSVSTNQPHFFFSINVHGVFAVVITGVLNDNDSAITYPKFSL